MKRLLVRSLGVVLATGAVGLALSSMQSGQVTAISQPTHEDLKLDCPPGDPMPSTSTLYGPSTGSADPLSVDEAIHRYLMANGLDPALSTRFEITSDQAAADLMGEQFMVLTEGGSRQAIAGLARDPVGNWRVVAFDSCLTFEQTYSAP